MLRLRLLGALDLTGAEGQRLLSVLAQPKRVALLAYLSVATPRDFQSRDKLLALLWPDSDLDHARNSLRQALHFLRRTLGRKALVNRGDAEVTVDPDQLGCDVIEFERALETGDKPRALELYGGDLLDGFYIAAAPGFEHWVAEERTRLRQLAAVAARELSEAAERNGDLEASLRWARKGVAIDAGDEVCLRRLIAVLDHQGNRAGAVQAYDDFAERLLRDCELEPSPETLAAIDAVRARDDAPVEPPALPPRRPSPAAVGSTTAPPQPATRVTGGTVPWRRRLSRPLHVRALLLTATLVLLLFASVGVGWMHSRTPSDAQVRSLAVLPFRSFGVQSEDRFFAEGFHEELLSQLSKIPALRVTARTSVIGYRVDAQDPGRIGDELGVRYLVQGSIQRAGDRVKIWAHLVDAEGDEQLWTESYDLRRHDLFQIQIEVAEQIANALQIRFSPEQRARSQVRPTLNAAAHEAYLRGRLHWSRGVNRSDAQQAMKFFEWATILDPEFAAAHAALAYSRLWLAFVFGEHTLLDHAHGSLRRAVALHADAPETWLAQGYYYAYGVQDQDRALERLARVIRAQPSNAEALSLMGFVQRRKGLWDEAAATMRRALELDPNSYNTTIVLGEMLSRMRRLNEAEQLFDRAIAISPSGELAYAQKALLYLYGRGDTTGARQVMEHAPTEFSSRYHTIPAHIALLRNDHDAALALFLDPPRSAPGNTKLPEDLLLLGLTHQRLGRPDLARMCADSIEQYLSRGHPPSDVANAARGQWPLGLAHSYTAMANVLRGRHDEAVAGAERAVELLPLSRDVHGGTEIVRRLADIYILSGRTEKAIDTLELLLAMPSRVTVHMLRLHPIYDPLRAEPRFKKLLETHATKELERAGVSVPASD